MTTPAPVDLAKSEPDSWWLSIDLKTTKPNAAARTFSTAVEVYTPVRKQWIEKPALESLGIDPSWQASDQAAVEAWIATLPTT